MFSLCPTKSEQVDLHAEVFEAHGIHEIGSDRKFWHLTDLEVLGDAVLHVVRRVLLGVVALHEVSEGGHLGSPSVVIPSLIVLQMNKIE